MNSIYTKLTARNRRLSGYTQLWLAPDHLLLLTSTRVAEQYKRFVFSDIQAIVVTELPSHVFPQVVMILAELVWISLLFAVESPVAKGSLAATGALALLWSIRDIARGPRCRCYLHTRVSGELLAPVSRMATARKFLAIVGPMIQAVQGVLPAGSPVENVEPAWEPPPPEIVSNPGYIPEILFGTFLLDAVAVWVLIHFPKLSEISGLLISTIFAEVMLIVVALLRRRGRDARVVTYVVIALAAIGLAFDLTTLSREFFGWYMTILERAKQNDRTVPPLILIPTGIRAIVAYSWRAAAGVIGLAAAFWERRKALR